MNTAEQKQIKRKRRERRLRGWLTTLSWSTPVIAFGGFFSIWHHISTAVNAVPAKTTHVALASSGTSQTSYLFKVGSSSPQVRMIQENLSQLGYFNHQITNYYGSVTEQSVRSFQEDNNLNPTGEVDSNTLQTLQQVVRDKQTEKMTQDTTQSQGSLNSASQDGTGSNGISSSNGDSGGAGLGQQTTPPVAISSAS